MAGVAIITRSVMEVPDYVVEGLTNIREGLHLRWNPRAVMVKEGKYDAQGKLVDPTFDPRWELWDTDPNGKEYRVMRLQLPDGSFRPPGQWLIDRIWKLHPARYNNDVHKMARELIDDPELFREIGTKKDSDDAIEAAANWAQWVATPKSGRALSYRGKRLLSS
jgi:hypothetical protein